MKRRMARLGASFWLWLPVAVCSLFWLAPLVLIFLNSFKSYNDMIGSFLRFPESFDLSMYFETWTMFKFPMLLRNTLFYTAVSVAGVILFAPMAAYKLARTQTRCSRVVFVLIILPMMVPFQAYMISLTKFLSVLRLNATRTGYLCAEIGLLMPLAVYMIYGYVRHIPLSMEESAVIDGAGPLTVYFRIVLPLLKPILATVVVLDALSVWNEVILNHLIVGSSEKNANLQGALYARFSAQTSDWEHALPGIVIAMIPSLLFFIFMQRHIVGGITSGSVKE